MVAPASLGAESVTLIWDKPETYHEVVEYRIIMNEERIGTSIPKKTHYTINDLEPETEYGLILETIYPNEYSTCTSEVKIKTMAKSIVLDVTKEPYNADMKGCKVSTTAIMQAINDCPLNGTVLIPEGATILTGALELKSNMILQVDGLLQGTNNPKDYLINKDNQETFFGKCNEDGLILTRYEGWELYCYRSLINVGYLNPENRRELNCENIRICGRGTIRGGGNDLGLKQRALYSDVEKYPEYLSDRRPGRRVRGRLISFIQCQNVHLTGVKLENPTSWTIHMIYCDTVTTHNINIHSKGVDNGDGWDPDSSQNCLIFDTTFDTGDDCIAIKSGKNPQGNLINIPTKNVKIFDLQVYSGHGIAIGSEMSGGIEDIFIRDCIIKDTLFGLELKAHQSRGGYIKNVYVQDCYIDNFMAHSVVYNADGIAAANKPYFENIHLQNTHIEGPKDEIKNTIPRPSHSIELIGFDSENQENYIKNVYFKNITLGEYKKSNKIYLEKCLNTNIENVRPAIGKTQYILDQANVKNITIDGESYGTI